MSHEQLEIGNFVADVARSVDFYRRVLGFEKVSGEPDGYTVMRSGAVHIALQSQSDIDDGHPIKPSSTERMGLGVEIALDVDDVLEAFK